MRIFAQRIVSTSFFFLFLQKPRLENDVGVTRGAKKEIQQREKLCGTLGQRIGVARLEKKPQRSLNDRVTPAAKEINRIERGGHYVELLDRPSFRTTRKTCRRHYMCG